MKGRKLWQMACTKVLQDPSKAILILLGGIFLIRLIFLILSPLELSPDEAYYWDWSRHLDWGYYSKPPMVAWLIGLSTSVLPVTEFGVRFPAVMLSVFTCLAIFLTASLMADQRAGLMAALSYSATIGSAVSGYIMTIDAPLLCFYAWTLYFLYKAADSSKKADGTAGSLSHWQAAGFFCGLGLLSKQTMVALSLSSVLFLLSFLGIKKTFRTKGVYWFYGVQATMLIPFLFWNWQHGWITFVHTAHHFEGAERATTVHVSTFLELIGSQAVIITPLVFILIICASFDGLVTALRGPFRKDGQCLLGPVLLLELSGFFPLLAIFFLSFIQRINANWPAPFYLSPCILLGLWIESPSLQQVKRLKRCKWLFKTAVKTGFIFVAILYVLPFVFSHSSLSGSSFDPTVRLKGWKALAAKADSLLLTVPRPEKTFVIARRRQSASELAFYMKGQPHVYRWNGPRGKIKSQYELWEGPLADKSGWDALVIVDAQKGLDHLDECFSSFVRLKEIEIRLGEKTVRTFNAYLGKGLIKWAR